MNDNPQHIRHKLGGRVLEIPVYKNKETTISLIKKIQDVFDSIQKKSSRIDTQQFALETAIYFALENARLKDELQEEKKHIDQALQKIEKRLQILLHLINSPIKEKKEDNDHSPETPPTLKTL